MDDLEESALSPPHAAGRENDSGEAQTSVLRVLRWQLVILGIIIGPPLLLSFPAQNAGLPGSLVPALYALAVTPFAAPLGVIASAAALIRHKAARWLSAILLVVFLVGSIAAWYLFLQLVIR